ACSGHENGSAFEPPRTEIREGSIGLIEWITCGLGDDTDLRRKAEEIDAILPREIGDRNKLTLFPKEPIGKARNVAHMDACANDASPLADCFQRQRHQVANRRKDDR